MSSAPHGCAQRSRRPAPVSQRPGRRGVTGRSTRRQATYVTDRSVTAEQYGRFLIGVFEEWVRRDVGARLCADVRCGPGQLARGAIRTLRPFPTCGLALAMEHNGDLYSCDHFVEPAYRLGNILETPMIELVASPQQQKFGQDKFDTLPAFCRACDVRFACHGGCPKDRFIATPEGELGLNYLCAGYKLFFHHVDRPMRLMPSTLLRNRAPAEIMQLYASRRPAAGAFAAPAATIPVPAAAAGSSSIVTAAARDSA